MIRDYYPLILHKYQEVENKQLLWELIKMEIRAETIRFPKRKMNQDSKICNDVVSINPCYRNTKV